MATDPTDPLPDIEAAIKEEVAGINAARRTRPPMRFNPPNQPNWPLPAEEALPKTEDAVQPPATPEDEIVSLPEVLGILGNHIQALDDHFQYRLTRIERALGIKS